jgi:hypothetical protein
LGQISVQLIGQGGQNWPKPADSQKVGSYHFRRLSAKLVGADMPPGLMIEYHLLKYSDGQGFSSSVLIRNLCAELNPSMHALL